MASVKEEMPPAMESGEKEAMGADEREDPTEAKVIPLKPLAACTVSAAGEGEKATTEAEDGASTAERGKKGATTAAGEKAAIGRMITVKSWDGKEFTISAAQARLSEAVLRAVLDSDDFNDDERKDEVHELEEPLNVRAEVLEKVLEYCSKHAGDDPAASAEELETWDRQFFDGIRADHLYDVLAASNYLGIEGISDACCGKIADWLRGMSVDELIRGVPNIDCFTKEEEEMIEEASSWSWVFED